MTLRTTKRQTIHVSRAVWFYLLLLILSLPFCAAQAQNAGEVVSVLGTAEVLRDERWQPLSTGVLLATGEIVRTSAGSRVAIQLSSGTQIKLNANSQLALKAIAPPVEGFIPTTTQVLRTVLRVLSGEIWVRNSGEPLEIQTVPATATIRGTEFTLAAGPNDSAQLAVLNGVVEFSNPQGSVQVAANEQATAKLGEAPRKSILLNPIDAVQWSFYYPNSVSYRDFPLSGVEPSRVSEQLAAVQAQVSASPQNVDALVALGELRLDAGQPAEARSIFAQALVLKSGHARARTGLGWALLATGEPVAAWGEFRQIQPPTLMSGVGLADALYQLNRLDAADRIIAATTQRFPRSPLPWTQAARNRLIQGQVVAARQAIDRALALAPNNALAYSLRSTIDLVQNQRAQALAAAEQAVAANPASSSAYLSLSRAQQVAFQLDAALAAARQAVTLDPENSQALIQESSLLFGMGQLKAAIKVAKRARHYAPNDAFIMTVWGFLQLARHRIDEARTTFQQAIQQDSTLGLPHLGLGLVLFRRNDTAAAVAELRKATLLEPQIALYNSYLGKAFYETKDDRRAQKYLEVAKQIDPHDPTPYLYDAIRLQNTNQPIAAVENLQKSIELNNDRAVYRSRLLLDEDLAARSATLGRIYNDIGFTQLGLREGWQSVSRDPTNYSTHRLLADSYSAMPGIETARVSELLQAQLLQPINITPIQPQLAETKLLIPNSGPITPSLYEFNPLFVRGQPTLFFSGLGGNGNTWGDDTIVSGLTDGFSYSFGQSHYQSNGYRSNNDLENNLYNLFIQTAVTPDFNLQAEYRHRETISGDLQSSFDGSFRASQRRNLDQDTARIGARYSLSPQTNVITSVIYTDRDNIYRFPKSNLTLGERDTGTLAEAQLLYRADVFNMITGFGAYSLDVNFYDSQQADINSNTSTQQIAYGYTNIKIPNHAIWTLRLSYESDKNFNANLNELSPKLGIQWVINDHVLLRTAAFKKVKRALTFEQTIEPTQVAGFNQLTDYVDMTVSKNYGAALDVRFNLQFFGGLEALRRDTDVPLGQLGSEFHEISNNQENFYKAYLYWLLSHNWALSASWIYEKFEVVEDCKLCLFLYPAQLTTISLPLNIQYFNPSGFFAGLDIIYVNQDIKTLDFNSSNLLSSHNSFTLANAGLGYRLPKRWGIIALQANNLFDRKFYYQDYSFQTGTATVDPLYVPERTISARLILNF